MARFHYRMQSILNIKMKMETQAKQEFAAAKNALDVQQEKLRALQNRQEGYERQAQKLLQGNLNLREIEENKQAILRMEDYITVQREMVRRSELGLERAREKLTEVMKERKTHETLRDKAFEAFVKEENREEGKAVDELTSFRFNDRT